MYAALAGHALLLVVMTWIVSRNCGTAINPVTYFAGFYALQTVLSPALQGEAPGSAETIGYSALYFAAIALPFMIRVQSSGYLLLGSLANDLLPRPPTLSSRVVYVALAAQLAVFFVLLIVASRTMDWLTAPRVAYQESRAGAGLWWSLSQSMLILLFAVYLSRKPRGLVATAMACIMTAAGAYFLGSKAFMLFPFVLAAFYFESRQRISRMLVFVGATCVVCAVFFLQLLQGTALTLLDTLAYFNYFTNTATFVQEFHVRFEHTWGATWLSNFWQFVPRAIYPDKPFIYGPGVIMETYFPGAGELGSNPGVLPWAAAYLDFGWFGVMLDGLTSGILARGAFLLLQKRTDMTSIVIFGQLGLIIAIAQPFFNAPFLVFWIWLAAQLTLLHFAQQFRFWFRRNPADSSARLRAGSSLEPSREGP